MLNKDDFWRQCLSHIKTTISDQAYSTWFDGLLISSLTNEEILSSQGNADFLGDNLLMGIGATADTGDREQCEHTC